MDRSQIDSDGCNIYEGLREISDGTWRDLAVVKRADLILVSAI